MMKLLPYFNNALRWGWIAIFVLMLDQIAKYLAITILPFNQPISILPSFNLTLIHNTGAAFGVLAKNNSATLLFGIFAVILSAFITVWLFKLPKNKQWIALALVLILGGALGNLVDRIHNGFVIDFIQLYYKTWYWPVFNIADLAISIGTVMLGLEALKNKKLKES